MQSTFLTPSLFDVLAELVPLAATRRALRGAGTELAPEQFERMCDLMEATGSPLPYDTLPAQLAKAWDAALEEDEWTPTEFLARAIAYSALALGLDNELEDDFARKTETVN